MKHTLPYLIFLLTACNTELPEDQKDRGTSTGTVEQVSAHGTDLTIKLKGDDAVYYLNRYLRINKSIDTFKSKLLNQQVTIKHSAHSTSPRPIDTLFAGNEMLY